MKSRPVASAVLTDQSWIEAVGLSWADRNQREVGMYRVEDEIRFRGNHRARYAKNGLISGVEPAISESGQFERCSRSRPSSGQRPRIRLSNEAFRNVNFEQHVARVEEGPVRHAEVDQDFEGCQSGAFGRVYRAAPNTRPASTVAPCALTVESSARESLLDDSPRDRHLGIYAVLQPADQALDLKGPRLGLAHL